MTSITHTPFSRRSLLAASGGLATAAALTGCGGEDASRPGTTLEVSASPSEGTLEGEITIWNRSGDLFKVFDEAIKKFTAANPGVKVNHQAVDIDAKLANTLISGSGVPDGSFLDDAKVAGVAEHLYDLTSLIDPMVADVSSYKTSIATVDGKIYGVPWDLDPGLLFYREDLLDKAGVDPASLTTYDSLLDAADRLRVKTGSAGPIHLEKGAFLGQLWLEMFANQSGTSMTDQKGELRLDSDEYRRIFTWLKTVADEGLGSHAEYTGPEHLQLLENGTEALVPWAIWFTFAPEQLLKETRGLWRAMPLPTWTDGGATSGAMGGSSFIIPAKAKNPELAWHLFRFLCLDPAGAEAIYSPNDLYPGGLNTSVPSYIPAADPTKPLFEAPEALGGQDLWKVATEAGKTIPEAAPIPSWWPKSVDYLGNNLQRLIEKSIGVDEVITDSTEKIQKNLIARS